MKYKDMFAPAEHIFTVMPYKKQGEREIKRKVASTFVISRVDEKRKRYPESCPYSLDISVTQSTKNLG